MFELRDFIIFDKGQICKFDLKLISNNESDNIIFEICKLILDDFEEIHFDNDYHYINVFEILLKLTSLKYRGNIKESINILEYLYTFTFDDKFSFYHNDDILKSIALLKNLK